MATAYISILSLVGLSFNSTYAIFNTLARTPTCEAVTAEPKDLIEVTAKEVDGLGKHQYTVTNVSNNKLWAYFNIDGPLGIVLQHINPVCLGAGESFKIPIRPANITFLEESNAEVNELGLLGWRNNTREFTGKITARVLNNFCSYEIGEVRITGAELYLAYISEKDDPKEEIKDIKTVKSILDLITEKNTLIEEKDKIIEERDALIEKNKKLKKEKKSLEDTVASMKDYIDDLRERLTNALDTSPSTDTSEGTTSTDTSSDTSPETVEETATNPETVAETVANPDISEGSETSADSSTGTDESAGTVTSADTSESSATGVDASSSAEISASGEKDSNSSSDSSTSSALSDNGNDN